MPKDQPTIQAGIDAANNGDTVLVAPGTYYENIAFMGKAITVTSSGGPQTTTIDGQELSTVVTFTNGEGPGSVLSGFTIQNGISTLSSMYDGGGIYINRSSPTVENNIVQKNISCSFGAGIAVYYGSPVIQENVIRNNMGRNQTCSGESASDCRLRAPASPKYSETQFTATVARHSGPV